MYNYIDEVPEITQDRVDMFFNNEDYYMDAEEILDAQGLSWEEFCKDYDAAVAESAIVNDFCECMGITPSDLNAMIEYYDALPERVEEEELDALHEQGGIEELAWYNHARQMGWE